MWTFLEPIIGFSQRKGIRYPLCRHEMPSLWLALTSSIHSFKLMTETPSVTPPTKDQGAGCLQRIGLSSGGWFKEQDLGNLSAVKVGFSRCQVLLFWPIIKLQLYLHNKINLHVWQRISPEYTTGLVFHSHLFYVLQLLDLWKPINVPSAFILIWQDRSSPLVNGKNSWGKNLLAKTFNKFWQLLF